MPLIILKNILMEKNFLVIIRKLNLKEFNEKKYFISFISVNVDDGCSKVENNTSFILVGVEGKNYVNYLQFLANKFPPAMNYRLVSVSPDIIALKVDTPLEDVQLSTITSGVAGYTGYGSFGYIAVDSKPINITKKGIYFYGILNTDKAIVNHEINSEFIKNAKKMYKNDFDNFNLKPINFKW